MIEFSTKVSTITKINWIKSKSKFKSPFFFEMHELDVIELSKNNKTATIVKERNQIRTNESMMIIIIWVPSQQGISVKI